MAAATSSSSSSSSSAAAAGSGPPPPPPPKILLAKPGSGPVGSTVAKFSRSGGGEDESVVLRSRLPPVGSLNLLSDSWDFHTDRILPFLTENTDFTVISIIGPTSVGKSTILNELYGFNESSPGMLPPFTMQSEETRALARHCTTGIELRISAERLILLDTQPLFSPSILAEMIRPDGSSSVSVLNGESLSADLAHELMGIQVDLLKHGIPDPSLLTASHSHGSNPGQDKENKDILQEPAEEFLASPLFIHTKLRDQYLSPRSITQLRQALSQYFSSSSFGVKFQNTMRKHSDSSGSDTRTDDLGSEGPKLFVLPNKSEDDSQRAQYGSYISMLEQLRNQILSMNCQPFAKTVSERDWLRNSARIWELVKRSPVIAEYSRTLQSSGLFRR
ncbi:uncharacterized protein LOC131233166 isoform X2 [Magnolia sinica]|uniref:uncharacterized protein LOC131233166 isoform X2 n=1 Tax=Magnolia sinica TaxID=86752 RepID=UPI00265A2E68|nr:uncharacterized protein LOC131233166 isoform X2 [Magnolia sinica]